MSIPAADVDARCRRGALAAAMLLGLVLILLALSSSVEAANASASSDLLLKGKQVRDNQSRAVPRGFNLVCELWIERENAKVLCVVAPTCSRR